MRAWGWNVEGLGARDLRAEAVRGGLCGARTKMLQRMYMPHHHAQELSAHKLTACVDASMRACVDAGQVSGKEWGSAGGSGLLSSLNPTTEDAGARTASRVASAMKHRAVEGLSKVTSLERAK